MARWELALSVDPTKDEPLFVQVAHAIAMDVRRGRLRPGDLLPGTRTLARTLGVHRNTVLAAYQELSAEGWIETSPAHGTFVSRELPDPRPRSLANVGLRNEVPTHPNYELRRAPEMYRASRPFPPGTLALAGGIPDVRLLPSAELARAYRRVLRGPGRALLGYGDSRGHAGLRAGLAQMLSATRGLAASRETILITRGSQMALYLVAKALLTPGELIVVENPGYRPAWEAFRLAGAKLLPISIDSGGVDVKEIVRRAERGSIRAIYLTPHHQYPTTATLSAARRLELLNLANTHRIAIIEDDYDHEFHYDTRPVLPLASVDTKGAVIYVGTLSKVLAPGLRIGYVVAPHTLIETIVSYRSFVDLQGDLAMEAAVADLLEAGEVQRHIRRARRVYQARRDFLAAQLKKQLGTALSYEAPTGGMALWAHVAQEIDLEAWEREAAAHHRVIFHTARRFTFDGRTTPHVRLGFAARSESEMKEAVRRMAEALKELPRKKKEVQRKRTPT